LITPSINIDSMNAFLQQFSKELPAGTQAVLVLDRAGWHTSSKLKIPDNVSLILLPPKSPELNPTESLWHYLRSHYWSNRLYRTWEDLKQAALDAWRAVCLIPTHDPIHLRRFRSARQLIMIRIRLTQRKHDQGISRAL
jgi:transposase